MQLRRNETPGKGEYSRWKKSYKMEVIANSLYLIEFYMTSSYLKIPKNIHNGFRTRRLTFKAQTKTIKTDFEL
jgi:hypothetical protein